MLGENLFLHSYQGKASFLNLKKNISYSARMF